MPLLVLQRQPVVLRVLLPMTPDPPDEDKPWFAQDPPIDPLPAIEAKARAEFKRFDAERQRLIAAHRKARTPKARLKTLAAIVRQHGEFMHKDFFCSGWISQSVLNFADAIDIIADEEL
jgi:hypothetical protein